MKVVNLGETNTVLNSFIAEIRDAHIQKDRMRFRINLERVGSIFAYEISKTLSYSEKEITTPLAIAQMKTADTPLVVTAILRAGLPLHDGILSFFDGAENAFLAAKRMKVSWVSSTGRKAVSSPPGENTARETISRFTQTTAPARPWRERPSL